LDSITSRRYKGQNFPNLTPTQRAEFPQFEIALPHADTKGRISPI
jgi:hypothetical protein